MKKIFSGTNQSFNASIDLFIENFDHEGTLFNDGERNVIKVKTIDGVQVNVKSFKVPNLINRLVYRFFRKSKAQRSFEYANILTKKGIGTPVPLAYLEQVRFLFFDKSYYVSEHVTADLTYRDLTTDLNYVNHEQILRAFTRFTYQLHERNVHFLDHSPGNTLIKKIGSEYAFYLVDLNRMEFEKLDFETRVKNFAKLTIHKSMVEVMSDEYAKCIEEDYERVFDLMWSSTQEFQRKFWRRRRLKNRLKFWKKTD